MAMGNHRVIKRRGSLTLVETANPAMGVGYAVSDGGLGLWNGDSLAEAEQQFEQVVSRQSSTAA